MKLGISPKRGVVYRGTPDGQTFFVIRVVYATGSTDTAATDVEFPYEYCGQSRWKSPKRLESAVKDACSGIRACWPVKYVEVLPWREDGVYPYPLTCYSFYQGARDYAKHQETVGQVLDVALHRGVASPLSE